MEKMIQNINALIHNRFDIEVRDAKTGELKQQAQAFNVICNALWTRLFNGNNYFNYIIYGEGTGTPSSSDTTLFTRINGVSAGNATSSVNAKTGVYYLQKRITIDESTSVGKTITEVGIGYDATYIVTHAMLQDMNGNPISITKTDTDIITFYATVYVHWNPNGYANGKIMLTRNNNTAGFLAILAGNGTLGDAGVYFMPGNGYSGCVQKTGTVTRTLSTKTASYAIGRLAVGDANSYPTTYLSVTIGTNPSIFIDASVLDYSNMAITGESVGSGDGSTTRFNTKFAIGSNAKIYVDGIEQQSGVTIKSNVFPRTFNNVLYNDLGRIFYVVDSQQVPAPVSSIGIESTITEYTPCAYVKNPNRDTVTHWTITVYGGMTTRPADVMIKSSNDFDTWTTIDTRTYLDGSYNSSTCHVLALPEHSDALYYQILVKPNYSGGTGVRAHYFSFLSDDVYGITFATPPAAGSVITADYVPACLPKDSDHVFDSSLTITLGEYVEP